MEVGLASGVSTSVFLFTDIEGSTRLWNAHGDAMGAALERHDEILRSAVIAGSGSIVKHTGDGVVARSTRHRTPSPPPSGSSAASARRTGVRSVS